MQRFIFRPSLEFIPGIRVSKDTELEYEHEGVKQSLKNLVFRSVTTKKGEDYESTIDTTITLKEGDILVFEDEGRGYIKPLGRTVCSIADAIKDLENIKDLGGE
jgi:hypothetical protein